MSGWTENAACRDMPKEAFFPTGDPRSPSYKTAVAAAKALCAACPVIMECREAGATEFGVWGALDEGERGFRLPRRPPMHCGTTQGHGLHLRRGEEPCPACVEAYEAKQAERRK